MTPNPDNYMLGAGEVLFDRFDAAGLSTGYRHLGNATAFGGATSVEKLPHKSSMSGARTTDKEVVIGSEHELTIVLEEFDPENLALALLGEVSTFSQDAGNITAGEINGGLALNFDRWYSLGKRDVSSVVIDQGGALTVDDDYVLNAELGLVKILSTGAGAEAVTTWDGDCGAISSDLVTALSVSKIEGRLKYFSASDQASGPRYEIDVHKVNLSPEGEVPFIGETWANFTLKGKAQKDITQPAGQEFVTIRKINASFSDQS
jgi:hypothetical protein